MRRLTWVIILLFSILFFTGVVAKPVFANSNQSAVNGVGIENQNNVGTEPSGATSSASQVSTEPSQSLNSTVGGGTGWTNAASDSSFQDKTTQGSPSTDTAEQEANSQLDELPTQSIDKFWQDLQNNYSGYLPTAPGQGLVHSILQNGSFNWSNMFGGILRFFLSEVFDNIQLLGAILVLAVLSAVLGSLQSAFEEQTVSQVAYAIIFLVLMLLAISSFTEAVGYARHAIQSMTDFMLTTVPLVVTLLAASGAPASAAFFHPLLLFSVHMISNVVFMLVFPLIFFAALLDLTSALSPRYKLTRLAGLLRTVGVSALGLSLSAFIGIASIQGLGKGIADGVTLRTAKFAVSTFVPVVGKALSDAATTVASASLLVKNAVGIAGLVIIVCLAMFPALKILALSFIYNGSAALMQPLGENAMVACLGSISKSLVLVFASVAAVALMFFISICILLASTNLAVMMQ